MLTKNQKTFLRFEYDFNKDGGAIGVISMRADITPLKAGYHVLDAYVVIEEGFISGGTPTLTIGNTNDEDGYFQNIQAFSGAGKAVRAGQVAGDLIFDNTNDVLKAYSPLVADDLDLVIEIGAAAVTAGKLSLYLEVIPREL